LLQSSAAKDFATGQWECVTGRIEQGESFLQAGRREAFEELGLEVHSECILGTTHLDRGDTLPEHEMVGVHYGCSIQDATSMQLSDEHGAYQWVTGEEAQALFPVGHWLRALSARAEVIRGLIRRELLSFTAMMALRSRRHTNRPAQQDRRAEAYVCWPLWHRSWSPFGAVGVVIRAEHLAHLVHELKAGIGATFLYSFLLTFHVLSQGSAIRGNQQEKMS
jgi:8-oxo-dGTP diphosphatase